MSEAIAMFVSGLSIGFSICAIALALRTCGGGDE